MMEQLLFVRKDVPQINIRRPHPTPEARELKRVLKERIFDEISGNSKLTMKALEQILGDPNIRRCITQLTKENRIERYRTFIGADVVFCYRVKKCSVLGSLSNF